MPERKKPLPLFPKQIGIITSPAAAALHDVLSTLQRRMPSMPVIVYPTPVQGAGASAKIAAAIQKAANRAECDVLILCRGGGSIEDLWAFNEEVVARAIAACPIPIISGVVTRPILPLLILWLTFAHPRLPAHPSSSARIVKN